MLYGARCRACRRSLRETAKATKLPGVRLDRWRRRDDATSREAGRADAMLLAVPAQELRAAATALAPHLPSRTALIACAKGIERGTHKFMTEVIAEAAPRHGAGDPFRPELRRRRRERVADRGDACFAPTMRWRSRWRAALGSATFRPYHATDVRGVEIGGAAKNVLAIAAGIVAGKQLGA